jgi:hypothetical protein
VRGRCNGRTAGMCYEDTMAKLWEGVGEATMAETHKRHKRGRLVGCNAHTGSETSVGML